MGARRRLPVHGLYALSGAVSLGYQVCWLRIFAGVFGSGALTFALVVASFIGGLGLGALASRRTASWLERRLRRGLERRHGPLARWLPDVSPLRTYGALEALVSLTAALTLLAGPLAGGLGTWGSDPFPYVLHDGVWGPGAGQWLARGLSIAALVFVPCFFMGTTFPLLCRVFPQDRRLPSGLYAGNTLGACLGVLTCEFVLFPTLGHTLAMGVWLLLNAGIAAAFLLTRLGAPVPGAPVPGAPDAPGPSAPAPGPAGGLGVGAVVLLAVASGLLTGAFEADVVRRLRFTGFRTEAALSFVSFWAVVAIFLGSASVRSWPGQALRVATLWVPLAWVVYAITWRAIFPLEDAVVAALAPAAPAMPADLPQGLLGLYQGQGGLVSTVVFTGVLVFPALFLLAWLLPAACDRLHGAGRHLGVAYGLNTLAFCAGTLLFGWVAPRVDVFYSTQLFLAVFAAVAVGVVAIGTWPHRARGWAAAALGACALAAVATPRGLAEHYFRPGDPALVGRVSALRSDGATTTFVVDDGPSRHLYFDAFSMSATTPGAQRYMRLMAHFPLLAQADPKRALVICFGVGNTASAAAAHPGIEGIDVVDLNREVFHTASEFAHANALVYRDPRVRLIHDDGRRFLSLTDQRYDLVTSEPPPPRHEGIYRLYSTQYYEAARERLTPTGMMTQWLTVRQMPKRAVDLAIRSFVEVFPHTLLFVGAQYDLVLLGSRAPIDLRTLERRYREAPQVRAELARIEVRSVLGLLARVLRSDRQLRADVGPGRTLSDLRNDWSYVFFGGSGVPRIPYDPLALWQDLGIEELANAEALARATRSVGLLRSHVADFPLGSLASLAEGPAAALVEGAELDWGRIHARNQQAHAARVAGRTDEARRLYRASLAEAPDQIRVWLWLARLAEEQGDAAAAAEAWSGYVRHNPDDAFGRHRLGAALLAQGHLVRAQVELEQARRLAPGSPEVARSLAELQRRRQSGAAGGRDGAEGMGG